MHRRSGFSRDTARCPAGPGSRLKPLLQAVVATLLLAGCSTLPIPGMTEKTAEPNLIAYAASLTRMEEAQLRQTLTTAHERWQQTARPRDRARLGLAYGQWGYGGYDPAAAARNLDDALAAQTAEWRQGERAFLEARAAELAYLAERESELAQARRETAHLRQALDEAERKLRAITAIERSLDNRNGAR